MVAAPEQGDLVKLNFDPTQGHEQRGYRPALVVSTTLFNEKTGFCWVVPVTSHIKGLPSECILPEGLGIHGVLLLSQLRALDWRARPFNVADKVHAAFLEDINARLESVLKV